MSLITMACPVCNETYQVGVVGSAQIGGHVCPVKTRMLELEEALAKYADHATVRCGWPNKGAGPKCVCGLESTLDRLGIEHG